MESQSGKGGDLVFRSRNAGKLRLPGFLGFARQTQQAVKDFNPDIIYAMSDPIYIILGHWLTRGREIRFFCDLQDNYETYASARLPGVRCLFRRALKKAGGVTCVSRPLSDRTAALNPNVLTLNNGVAQDLFFHRNRQECRRELGLPADGRLMGFAGTIDPQRGTDILFSGLLRLKSEFPDLQLALAGAVKGEFPRRDDIHYLGQLPHQKIPVFLNALNLAVMCNRESEFYDYTFPIKTYEILACGVPFIAAAHVSTQNLLRDYPDGLFQPDDPESFVQAARTQFREPNPPRLPILTWEAVGAELEQFLKQKDGRQRTLTP